MKATDKQPETLNSPIQKHRICQNLPGSCKRWKQPFVLRSCDLLKQLFRHNNLSVAVNLALASTTLLTRTLILLIWKLIRPPMYDCWPEEIHLSSDPHSRLF